MRRDSEAGVCLLRADPADEEDDAASSHASSRPSPPSSRGPTEFAFDSACTPLQPRREPGRLRLGGPRDLGQPGYFDARLRCWRRCYTSSRSGVDLAVLEDVPDEPTDDGEMTLWPAALVLARELEGGDHPFIRHGGASSSCASGTGGGCSGAGGGSPERRGSGTAPGWLRDGWVAGARVVEVGAGAGLPSSAACLAGAGRVLATEGSNLALRYLGQNCAANAALLGRLGRRGGGSGGSGGGDGNSGDGGSASRGGVGTTSPKVLRLWWGDRGDEAAVAAALGAPCVATVGMTGVGMPSGRLVGGLPDLILGSDVSYSRRLHGPLLGTLGALLPPWGLAVLAHDCESTPLSRTALRDFVAAARACRAGDRAAGPDAALGASVGGSGVHGAREAAARDGSGRGCGRGDYGARGNGCGGGERLPLFWCVEAPPSWRPALLSSGVDGTRPGRPVPRPCRHPSAPTTGAAAGAAAGTTACTAAGTAAGTAACTAAGTASSVGAAVEEDDRPAEHPWEAASVSFVLLRRRSPLVDMLAEAARRRQQAAGPGQAHAS